VAAFIKSLAVGFAILGGVVAMLSRLLPSYSFPPALAGLILMAFNAFAAIAFFNLLMGKGNLVRASLTSLMVRFTILAGIMVAGMEVFRPNHSELLSFVVTAFVGYIAFQALEIRYFMRLQAQIRLPAQAAP
jgi:hypothetical protein